MNVKDAMCRDFKIVGPETTLLEAAEAMREYDCGYLPIGANDRLMGAVTDRDIVIRGLGQGYHIETTVDTIMTGNVVYCFEDEPVEDAAERMKSEQIRRLVVLNRDKRMVGILTVGDIARASEDNRLTGEIENCVAKAA